MQIRSYECAYLIPAMAVFSTLAAAAWLPAVPAASVERVLALFQNNEPEKAQIPDTLFLSKSESALLPHWAPWGFP